MGVNQTGATSSTTSKGLAIGGFRGNEWAPGTPYKAGAASNNIEIRPNRQTLASNLTVQSLAVADWNRDGFDDLLEIGAQGVIVRSHIPSSSIKWKSIIETGVSAVPMADAVPFDLNRDDRLVSENAECAGSLPAPRVDESSGSTTAGPNRHYSADQL